MTLVITSTCIDVKDGICTTVCPVDCIYEGERMFYIHPTECIECGMCESICPVDAIRYADEVEEAQHAFLAINDAAFRDGADTLLEPGGWSKGDEPLKDPPGLATLAEHYLRKDTL
nr:ferredoxin family protein [uncultured Roseibium sp.]